MGNASTGFVNICCSKGVPQYQKTGMQPCLWSGSVAFCCPSISKSRHPVQPVPLLSSCFYALAWYPIVLHGLCVCVSSTYCLTQGWRRTWHDFCDSVWNWRDAAAGQPAHHNTAISKRRRFEAVSKVVQQLPVELHATEENLRNMSLPELKVIG